MAPQAKSTILDLVRWLLLPALSAVVSAAYAVGTFRGDYKQLEARIEEHRRANEMSLSTAISVRKADQAAIITDLEATKAILRDTVPILKELSKGQSETKEAVARLEVSVSYLTKSIDEMKNQPSK